MSNVWKQRSEQQAAAEVAWKARLAAEAAAEAAKTPEQKAEEARKKREQERPISWCDFTEEHARHPRFYAAQERRGREISARVAEERRISQGGHPKVDLSQGFPSLGSKK